MSFRPICNSVKRLNFATFCGVVSCNKKSFAVLVTVGEDQSFSQNITELWDLSIPGLAHVITEEPISSIPSSDLQLKLEPGAPTTAEKSSLPIGSIHIETAVEAAIKSAVDEEGVEAVEPLLETATMPPSISADDLPIKCAVDEFGVEAVGPLSDSADQLPNESTVDEFGVEAIEPLLDPAVRQVRDSAGELPIETAVDELAVEAIESPLETSDELPNKSPVDEFDVEARILSADETPAKTVIEATESAESLIEVAEAAEPPIEAAEGDDEKVMNLFSLPPSFDSSRFLDSGIASSADGSDVFELMPSPFPVETICFYKLTANPLGHGFR